MLEDNKHYILGMRSPIRVRTEEELEEVLEKVKMYINCVCNGCDTEIKSIYCEDSGSRVTTDPWGEYYCYPCMKIKRNNGTLPNEKGD